MSSSPASTIRAIFNTSTNVANDTVGLFRLCLHNPDSAAEVAAAIEDAVHAEPGKLSMGIAILALLSESLIMINGPGKQGPLYDAHKTLQRAALTLAQETGLSVSDVNAKADVVHRAADVGASIASGS